METKDKIKKIKMEIAQFKKLRDKITKLDFDFLTDKIKNPEYKKARAVLRKEFEEMKGDIK